MVKIPSAADLGERPRLQAPRAVADYGAAGAGVSRAAAIQQRAADRAGTELVKFGGGLEKLALEIGDAESRIQTRQDAVLRAKDYGAFNERSDTELRRLMTEDDLALPATVEKYGQFLDTERDRVVKGHAGSSLSRTALSEKLEASSSAMRGRVATMALEAQDKAVVDHMGGRMNVYTSRAYEKPGSLVDLYRSYDAEVDDMLPALRPEQERSFRRAGRERIAEAAIGGLIARGAMPEAKKLMGTPGLAEILGEQAQGRINAKLFEADRAIADAETAGLRKRAELGALLGRQPNEDELRTYAGLAPKTDKLTELRTLLGREPTPEERAQAAGVAPKDDEQLVKVLNPDGTVKYAKRSEAVGQSAPDEATMVMGPDGKPIYMRGGVQAMTALQTGMTQAAQTELDKAIIAATGTRMQATEITRKFKPEYQEIPTKIGMEWTALKEKGGGWFGKASAKDKAALTEFVQYRAESAQLFANILKEMSGVAINPTEFERAEAWLPNPGSGMFDGDSPSEMKGKTERFIDFQNKVVARLSYARKHGLAIKDVSLDDMPQLIQERWDALDKQFEQNGMTEVEIRRRAVREQIAREFGFTGQ
jgi:hypothetical protein